MKRENVKKNIGIISAFADGKTIQILNERGEWVDLTEREGLPIGILEEEPNNFRTKPEPKYRPFKEEYRNLSLRETLKQSLKVSFNLLAYT